jgi:hypothetical protein
MFLTATNLIFQLGTGRCNEKFIDCNNTVRLLSDISELNCRNSRYIIAVPHRVSCRRGKKGQKNLHVNFFVYYRNKLNMLLKIIFLVLITNLSLVSGDSDFGITKLNNLYWTRVGIGVLTV